MSEFKFGYKSPTHEVEVQIPVCLLGRRDPEATKDIITSAVSAITQADKEPEVEDDKKHGLFYKNIKKSKEENGIGDAGDKITIGTVCLLALATIINAATGK